MGNSRVGQPSPVAIMIIPYSVELSWISRKRDACATVRQFHGGATVPGCHNVNSLFGRFVVDFAQARRVRYRAAISCILLLLLLLALNQLYEFFQ